MQQRIISFVKINKKDFYLLLLAVLIASLAFAGFYAKHAGAETESLSVTVTAASTFVVTTNDFAGTFVPGTPVRATSTLSVTTNTAGGWYIELYGDDRDTGDTTMDLGTDAAVGITDDTEWIPATATSSTGNATNITLGDDILAFRVMSASGTARFLTTDWWGTSDADYNASQEWAGFASNTAANLKIGEISSGDYNAAEALNTVQYYLDVGSGQQTGAYGGNIIYTLVTP